LLFYTTDLEEFTLLLERLVKGSDVCLNIICRGTIDSSLEKAIAGILPFYGRQVKVRHRTFQPSDPNAQPVYALAYEVGHIFNLLWSNFNKYMDFLPSTDLLTDYIKNKTVIVNRSEEGIDGFIIYHSRGKVADYNYLFCRSRDITAYAMMLNSLYAELRRRNINNFFGWVDAKNTMLLRTYIKAGYELENISNYFFKNSCQT